MEDVDAERADPDADDSAAESDIARGEKETKQEAAINARPQTERTAGGSAEKPRVRALQTKNKSRSSS